MDVLDLQVRIFLQDQRAERQPLIVERHIGQLLERRLQAVETFKSRIRPWELLVVECDRSIVVVHRHQALVEITARDSGGRTALALQRKLVHVFARDPFERRDGVGADALVGLRMKRAQVQVARVEQRRTVADIAAVRHRHHLRAAGHDQIGHPGHDRRGCEIDRGDARAAEPVQRHAAAAHVIAGIERRHPAEIAALLRALRTGAPDHVVDFFGLQAVAFRQSLEHRRPQALRMNLRKRALRIFPNAAWRAAGVDDPGFGHGIFSLAYRS